MNRACQVCGIIYFHVRAEDGVLICHNNHIQHYWNGAYLVPIVI